MDVILHCGTHRTGTTSFQHYMRAHAARFDDQAVGFWGPWRTRKGLFHGLTDRPGLGGPAPHIAGRIRMNLAVTERRGTAALIISDENLIGTPRANLRAGALYPQIGERMARVHAAFGGLRRVVLQIRAQDAWWASALSYMIPRGVALPDDAVLAKIAASQRSWRHVISDLSCACPGAEIIVTPFERFGARPDLLYTRMTGALFVPRASTTDFWANRSPDLPSLRRCLEERGEDPGVLPPNDGRWQPFTDRQASALREAYADDLFWLKAGADGLAILTEDPEPERLAPRLAKGLDERGRRHDRSARRLAQTR